MGRPAWNQATRYEHLGGKPVLWRLVERLYDLKDGEPQVHAVRKLQPTDLSGSYKELF